MISRERVGYIYYSWDFRHEKVFSWTGSQMSQCYPEARSNACFMRHFGLILAGSCGIFFNCLVTVDDTWIHIYHKIQRPKNNPRMETQWFPRVQRNSRHRSHQARCWHLSSGTEMSRQAFERNVVSSRQCFSSQDGNYKPENWQINTLKF
jgi:hypothetical protein